MAQMYKIFINEVPVIIQEGNKIDTISDSDELNPVYHFTQRKEIDKSFRQIEAAGIFKSLTIIGEDIKEIRKILFAGYKKIKAAGGVVFNQSGEILMIFRRNMWDLPKGKIDPGEKKKAAAIREVREETGVLNLKIIRKLMKSYHTYALENNTRVLKVTHWYIMMSSDLKQPVPQIEEGIEIVRWVDPSNIDEKLKQTYRNIAEVLRNGISVMEMG